MTILGKMDLRNLLPLHSEKKTSHQAHCCQTREPNGTLKYAGRADGNLYCSILRGKNGPSEKYNAFTRSDRPKVELRLVLKHYTLLNLKDALLVCCTCFLWLFGTALRIMSSLEIELHAIINRRKPFYPPTPTLTFLTTSATNWTIQAFLVNVLQPTGT